MLQDVLDPGQFSPCGAQLRALLDHRTSDTQLQFGLFQLAVTGHQPVFQVGQLGAHALALLGLLAGIVEAVWVLAMPWATW